MDNGRKFSPSLLSAVLGLGVIFAIFNKSGTIHSDSDLFIRVLNGCDSKYFVSLSRVGVILSWPFVLHHTYCFIHLLRICR